MINVQLDAAVFSRCCPLRFFDAVADTNLKCITCRRRLETSGNNRQAEAEKDNLAALETDAMAA